MKTTGMERVELLIDKFLNGQLSSPEKKELLDWLKQNKENQIFFKQIESLYHAVGIISNFSGFDSERAFNQFQHKINQEKYLKKTKLRYLLIGAASVAASILVTALLTFNYFSGSRQNAVSEYKIVQPERNVPGLEIVTAKGSRTNLTLADGTKIWLNSSSKLVYPQQFTGNTREVYLEGEGYFEVASNKQKPFYVKAGAIDVKVTGTIFNLKNYPEDNIIETTLIEGEVIIEKNEGGKSEELIILEPNQKITFHKSSESFELTKSGKEKEKVQDLPIQKIEKAVLVENANIEKAISWKNNIIIFENEPFSEIVHNLERRFGVNIIFRSESIKQLRFSGTFEEISIEQALEAMQFASPFNYTIEKDTIFISDKN